MKTRPVGAELFYWMSGETDRHDDANINFSNFEKASKGE